MYVRHRKRMVHASVYADLKLRLENRGWFQSDVPLLEGSPLSVIPAFPDDIQGHSTAINTLAINNGEPADTIDEQMGGGLWSKEYTFHLAFYAVSDAAADALFQDLNDEWVEDIIPLYDDGQNTPTPVFVGNMEVESFAWTPAPDQMSLVGKRLHFGRLILTDYIDTLKDAS